LRLILYALKYDANLNQKFIQVWETIFVMYFTLQLIVPIRDK